MDIFDELDTIGVPKREIHNYQLWLPRFDRFNRLGAVFGFSAHYQVRFTVDDLRQPLPDHGMVVHQQDADSFNLLSRGIGILRHKSGSNQNARARNSSVACRRSYPGCNRAFPPWSWPGTP